MIRTVLDARGGNRAAMFAIKFACYFMVISLNVSLATRTDSRTSTTVCVHIQAFRKKKDEQCSMAISLTP